jgi:Protein of unknown function (DUF1566)
MSRSIAVFAAMIFALMEMHSARSALADAPFPVPDTMQSICLNDTKEITCPAAGDAYFGQDAQHKGVQPNLTDNGDGTVTDKVTGLMWAKTPDLNGDGAIKAVDKRTYKAALEGAKAFALAGHNDWRLPTIKEMYSLMDFRGVDPSGYTGTDTSGLIPFVDRKYFDFAWGDTDAGERMIDSQMVSSTLFVGETPKQDEGYLFGVNFADGRIKGYGLKLNGKDKTFFVMYVRGKVGYGVNDLKDNGDGTINDASSGLMWAKADSGKAMDWSSALAWAQTQNKATYLGHADWRLPNVKELLTLVDYTRSPSTTASPAIDPMFDSTTITNEAGQVDFPFYWSSTTHLNRSDTPGNAAAYVSFGRAMGYMKSHWYDLSGSWYDVHGAGAQRSDPKTGDPTVFPKGRGPQGDAIRILNFARLVRDME